jgi:DNA-binding MarR family transcriptional regulator
MTRPTERWSGWPLQWFAEHQADLRRAARQLELEGARSPMAGESMSVLICLLSYANQVTLEAWPAQETIAHETDLEKRTVRRCLDTLEEAGWLERGPRAVTGRRGRPPVSYRLTLPGLEEAAAALRPEPDAPADQPADELEHAAADQPAVDNSSSGGICAPICAPISAPYGAQNQNLEPVLPPPDSYARADDRSAVAGEPDQLRSEKLAQQHLQECPPSSGVAGEALQHKVRQRMTQLLQVARRELPGADQATQDEWCLDQAAAQRGQTRSRPVSRQVSDEQRDHEQRGQVLLEAGLLQEYQAWCRKALPLEQLEHLVAQVAAGELGHADAAEQAQEWLARAEQHQLH